MAPPILYTVTIDTEEEWDWDGGWPTEELSVSNIAQVPRFQAICDRHGAAATYFVNQAVLDSPPACDTILKLADAPNVEIGMHIHPWNTRPLVPGKPVTARDTFLNNHPLPLIREKLASVYESFSRYGLKPTSFRGGRYSTGEPVQEFLQQRGFVADASICPFSTWADEGAPDYRNRGLEPRRVAPRGPGEAALWEIPLTLAFTRRPFQLWQRWYDFVEHSWLGKLRLIGIGERLGLIRKVWLNFESPLCEGAGALLRLLQRQRVEAICFTLHSSSLMAGGNSFSRSEADAARVFKRADEMLGQLSNDTAFQPATVTQVAERLEESYHARLGN